MSARQFYYAESTGESTTTTTGTYQDKTTLTFTPDASSTYFVIATWLIYSASTNSARRAFSKFRNDTAGTDFNLLKQQQTRANGQRVGASIAIEAFGGSPASQDYKIQYVAESAQGTAKIQQARVIALKKAATDESAESNTRDTTTSTSYQDKTVLTFTPASTGDYIVIAVADIDYASNSTNAVTVALDVDGTEYTAADHFGDTGVGANLWPWASLAKVNLSNASHTIKIKYKAGGGSITAGIANAKIVALRADTLENNYFAEQRTRQTTTNASYQDELTLTQTPQAVNHLMFVAGMKDNTQANAQGLEGATSFGEVTDGQVTGGEENMLFHMWSESLAASSTTWKIQLKSNGVATAGIDEMAISVIQLDVGNVTTTQTIQGLARVTATATKTVLGLARITATTVKTILGKADILKAATQTIQGLTRITASATKTIQGISRITTTATRTIQGIADILSTTTKTILGLAQITILTARTILGLARITASTTKTITGLARVTATTTRTILGLGDILKATVKTIQGVANIGSLGSQTIQGLARVTATATKTILGLGDILKATIQTIQGLARITKSISQTIQGLARITASATKTITGLARITVTVSKTILGIARITISSTQTILGKARVTVVTTRTVQGLSKISTLVSKSITGKADILATTTRIIQGVANVTANSSPLRNIFGKATIAQSSHKTITGVARILGNVEDIFSQPGLVTESGEKATILSSGNAILEELSQNV